MYDLSVIGAGWAGFNAALKAKEKGLKVCLIEQDRIGGTCLNYGCIPTKSLIQSAKIFQLVKKSPVFGIDLQSPSVSYKRIQERKDQLIELLAQGMQSRLREIEYIKSKAMIISPNQIQIENRKIESKFILIAAGSIPLELAGWEFVGKIISSNEALFLKEIPESLLVIGGGFIGLSLPACFPALAAKLQLPRSCLNFYRARTLK